MPNCDFYASIEDHEIILNYLFEQKECAMYELASNPEEELKQFFNASQVLNEFERYTPNGVKWSSVHLQLVVLDASPIFIPRKIILNPKYCNGFTYRYSADGFGLVQLYLEVPNNNSLSASHTNHNSRKRAEKWASTIEEKTEVASYDFDKITKFSCKLNRAIRKNAVGKLFSNPVLSGAMCHWNKGFSFGPYEYGKVEIEVK